MEVYKRETKRLLTRFLRKDIGFLELIPALDSALAQFIPRMRAGDLDILRDVMLSNNEAVMKEMELRGSIVGEPV
jgi:hypothetical protein